MSKKFNEFSVVLGLLDYINPIFYAIIVFTILNVVYSLLNIPYNFILVLGALLSIIFGFVIPTVKVLIGLKVIEFKLPVKFVFLVNLGILLFGSILFKFIFNIKFIIFLIILVGIIVLLGLVYIKTKSINTIAVLLGAFGYLLMYASLITLSIRRHLILPVVLYALAIIIFTVLCGIGIKANLKSTKVHWVIEISNIICQGLVMIATIILFYR